jgi:hypothetical protein
MVANNFNTDRGGFARIEPAVAATECEGARLEYFDVVHT